MTRKERWSTIAVVALVGAVHAWSLMRFPPPFVDEAWMASRAWAFVQTNRQFGPLDKGVFDRFEGSWTAFPWLPTAIQSLAARLVPEPGLLPMRLLSLLLGFALLATIYAIARALYSRKVALLSVLLLAFSWPFLYSAHLARADILTAALGFAAIALYFSNPLHRFLPGLISGLCLGAAFETHAHSAIFVPALGALYFYDLRWSLFRKASFWGTVTGLLLGLVAYCGLHLLPYPESYAAIYHLAFTGSHVPPLLSLDLGVLIRATFDLGLNLVLTHHAMSIVVVMATAFLLRRRWKSDQRLLVLNAVLLLGALLLIRNKALFYVILFSPPLALMAAAFLSQLLGRPLQRSLRDRLVYALAVICSLGAILINLLFLQNDSYRPYQAAQARIVQSVRPGDTILAPQTYWFGLYDHTYYSWENLVWFARNSPGSSVEDAFREFRPAVLIIDSHFRGFISDSAGKSALAQSLSVPAAEMRDFLVNYAELVDEFEIDYFGLLQVYRIDWEEASNRRASLSTNRDGLQQLGSRPASGGRCAPAERGQFPLLALTSLGSSHQPYGCRSSSVPHRRNKIHEWM